MIYAIVILSIAISCLAARLAIVCVRCRRSTRGWAECSNTLIFTTSKLLGEQEISSRLRANIANLGTALQAKAVDREGLYDRIRQLNKEATHATAERDAAYATGANLQKQLLLAQVALSNKTPTTAPTPAVERIIGAHRALKKRKGKR